LNPHEHFLPSQVRSNSDRRTDAVYLRE
jgi:hypothetical protein